MKIELVSEDRARLGPGDSDRSHWRGREVLCGVHPENAIYIHYERNWKIHICRDAVHTNHVNGMET
jgi:hypothetical protein